jgi:beta-lactamase superfamily II metal-dependent hydrolase
MEKLRVRVYNVRFGDSILVSIPDKGPDNTTTLRHILIDVGNAASTGGAGGANELFIPVVENILDELGGKGLDLYIMTHEHMDHVQGLLYADKKVYNGDLKARLGVQYAWLTGSSEPNYFVNNPKAEEKKKLFEASYHEIARYLSARGNDLPDSAKAFLEINNPNSTGDCVDYLRSLSTAGQTYYIYRGVSLKGKHNFHEASFQIWAPEQDTSIYYEKLQPLALNVVHGLGAENGTPGLVTPLPPRGVDAGAFYDLVESRKRGVADNMLAIDKAENNTSIVFCLKWRGWRLLFTGDAELKSWQVMNQQKVLKRVDFLKVGHHGSRNATPAFDQFKRILPKTSKKPRKAVVSTYDLTYPGVPDPTTLDLVRSRTTLWDTRQLKEGEYYDIEFEG